MGLPLDIIRQPEAANKLHTSSTKLPLPLPRSSGFENEVLLLMAGRPCGGTGGGPLDTGPGVNVIGVDMGEAEHPDFGGRGGAGGGRWCRSVPASMASGDIMRLDGIIEPFFGTRLGWMGGGDDASHPPANDSSNEDFDDLGGRGGAVWRGGVRLGVESTVSCTLGEDRVCRDCWARLVCEILLLNGVRVIVIELMGLLELKDSRSVPNPESRKEAGLKKMYSLAQRGDLARLTLVTVDLGVVEVE